MFKHILILCHANICRSPVAEALLKLHAPDCEIQSAGLHALPGLPAAPLMVELLRERNIDLSSHRSRQLSAPLLAWADLVLVMDRDQQKTVEQRFPISTGKVHCVGKWEACDIPDPYQKDKQAYTESVALIERCLTGWQTKIGR